MITKNGFTLVELLVVVLIIGILAAVAVPGYTRAVEKSRAAEALQIVRAIANANDRYFLLNDSFTDNLDNLDIQIPGNADSLGTGDGRKSTNLFNYGTRLSLKAVGHRLPWNTKYFIAVNHSNDSVCGVFVTGYGYVCENLGGKKEADTAKCNAGIIPACYVIK